MPLNDNLRSNGPNLNVYNGFYFIWQAVILSGQHPACFTTVRNVLLLSATRTAGAKDLFMTWFWQLIFANGRSENRLLESLKMISMKRQTIKRLLEKQATSSKSKMIVANVSIHRKQDEIFVMLILTNLSTSVSRLYLFQYLKKCLSFYWNVMSYFTFYC